MDKSESISEEKQWQMDARAFVFGLIRDWHTWVGSFGGIGVIWLFTSLGGTFPVQAVPLVMAVGIVWGSFSQWQKQKRRSEIALKERDELIKKQTPVFIPICNSSLPECKVSTTQDYYRDREIYGMMQKEKFLSRPAVWFRMIVNVECPTSIEKCTGYITKIEKKSNPLPIPEKFQVTFCNGSEPDAFAKTISKGVPEYLDILYWEQDVGIRIFSKVQPNSVDMVKLFSEQGEYILTVVVTGGSGIAPKEVRMKFNWTGKIDTTELTLI